MRFRRRTKVPYRLVSLAIAAGAGLAVTFCAAMVCAATGPVQAAEEPPHPAALDTAIVAAAKRHGVPERLVRRVIMRESKYNPRARNRAYWGLMQISYPTAKSMGFTGTPQELLNPVVNLRYAVPYLANAFVIAGRREDAAVRLYAAGYYATAKSRGLISALRTAASSPLSGVPEEQPMLAANAVVQPPQSIGIFGALFGPGSQPQPQAQTQPAQQVASASVDDGTARAVAAAPAASAAAPPGTFDGPKETMVAGKDGQAAPPKKWTRDGGTTLIPRGEQGLEQIASRSKADDTATSRKSRRHARKVTAFAALDLPASTAQAYTAPAAQDPRFAAAASQAAIAQATAAQAAAAPGQPSAQPNVAEQTSRSTQAAAAPAETVAEDEKPKKRKRVRQARKVKAGDRVKEARAEKNAAPPASVAPPTAAQ